jgi:hypothetical protein
MRKKGGIVIRQAISCDICGDICGTDKKQINHWFVVSDHGAELRVSGWNSSNRLAPKSMHLCGQTCLHKLLDDFMAKILSGRVQMATQNEAEEQVLGTDTSLTSNAAYQEVEPPELPPLHVPMELVSAPVSSHAEAAIPPDETPRFALHNWRAEAWARERDREVRAVEHRSENGALRRAGS